MHGETWEAEPLPVPQCKHCGVLLNMRNYHTSTMCNVCQETAVAVKILLRRKNWLFILISILLDLK